MSTRDVLVILLVLVAFALLVPRLVPYVVTVPLGLVLLVLLILVLVRGP